ncbi:hypothetical protein [Peptoniphilus sp.]|jgi:ABC-type xylose transport system permease subunit|uniref:hypothetical protein n=1 Tax=Peptoniphilus sp. TaxID=1971214 RepID=UPI003D93C221
MNREKIAKILEKILIFLVTVIMVLVLINQYIRTSQGARNPALITAQIYLIIIAAIVALIMSLMEKNKSLTIVLIVMYVLAAGLYYIFKGAGRI